MSRKTVVEEAVIQMKNLEDALKENAKGILASTMRQEINSLVKESLKEQDEVEVDDEEEAVIASPEGEEDVEVDDEETFDVEDDEMDDVEDDEMDDVEDDEMDDVEDDEMADVGMVGADDEETIDMRGASDEDVAIVFSKMGKNDKVSIEKIGDYYDLKDMENDTEYIIKLNESEEDYLNEFDSEETLYELEVGDDSMGGDIGLGEDMMTYEDMSYEDELGEDMMTYEDMSYEDELGEDMMTYEGMDGLYDDELGEDMMTYEDMSYEDELGEDMMTYEDMSYEDELGEDSWSSMSDETDKFKVNESKQKTGSASKFKYSKKPNQEGGFNTKMKEGSKRYGKSGKAKFDFDNEDPNSEIVMKIINKIKGGKKSETKEASRTLGAGRRFGRKGLNKPVAAPRHLKEEVEILREKNDEYRKALDLFRTKLNEVAVFNSNLAYATRLFTEHSTTKQEKINILRRFDNVESLKESKSLYQILKNELSNNTLSDKSINESINRTVMKAPSTGSAVNLIESKTYENPQFLRMKDLMGKLK